MNYSKKIKYYIESKFEKLLSVIFIGMYCNLPSSSLLGNSPQSSINPKSIPINEYSSHFKNFDLLALILFFSWLFFIVSSIFLLLLIRKLLEGQNESNLLVKKLFSGSDQGIFIFNINGEILKKASQNLDIVLPGSQSIDTLQSLGAIFANMEEELITTNIKQIWKDEASANKSISNAPNIKNLPKQIVLLKNERIRNILFEYKLIRNKRGKFLSIAAIVKDITEQYRNEKIAHYQMEKVKIISKAANNKECFKVFIKENDSLIRKINFLLEAGEFENKSNSLQCDLHFLKGSLATFDFSTLSKEIHELESLIQWTPISELSKCFKEKWYSVVDQWTMTILDLEKTLEFKKNKELLMVDQEKFQYLEKHRDIVKNPELSALVENLKRNEIKNVFKKYHNFLNKIASKNQKQVKLSFASNSCEVSFSEIQKLDKALTHILINSIDHGIESVEQREKIGKTIWGNITIKTQRTANNSLHITVEDDGDGINLGKLVNRAIVKGVWTKEKARKASDQEKRTLIFYTNLSTKDDLTEYSGRGKGMNAVKGLIKELGGTITIYSRRGNGTKTELQMPSHKNHKLKLVG